MERRTASARGRLSSKLLCCQESNLFENGFKTATCDSTAQMADCVYELDSDSIKLSHFVDVVKIKIHSAARFLHLTRCFLCVFVLLRPPSNGRTSNKSSKLQQRTFNMSRVDLCTLGEQFGAQHGHTAVKGNFAPMQSHNKNVA